MATTLSLITATRPARLSKAFELVDGTLTKLPGGQLVDGTAERLTLKGIEDLAALLARLNPAQALVYGVSEHQTAHVLTAAELGRTKKNGGPPLVARTRDHFTFPAGEAVFMLDYDPAKGQAPMTADELLGALYRVCPALESAPHVLTASASSFIFQGDECLRGAAGWRVLFIVQDVSDVPRAGTALFQRAWLHGFGRIEISSAGSLLTRGLLDDAVWQPERLDFCGGAACKPPLEQRRPAPRVFNPDAEPLDTRQAIQSLTLAEQAEFRRLVDEARKAAQPEAERVQAEWIEQRVEAGLAGVPGGEREQRAASLRETYRQAVKGGTLLADFEVRLSSGEPVTVGELLDNPDKYHGRRCADPLEPDGPDRRAGYINLRAAGRPHVFSHLHGGRRFLLHRARKTIRLVQGERVSTSDKALELMRLHGGHFDFDGKLVRVAADAKILPRDKEGVLVDLDTLARWEKYDARSNGWRPCDCDPRIATAILAAPDRWGLPRLTSVCTAPTMTPEGRLIDREGFDAETGVLLVLSDPDAWSGIPERPTDKDVEKAISTLWHPFERFPFCGAIDKGVMLGAILTAVMRPALSTRPLFAFDAPTAGSGKTLLAVCIAVLAGDDEPALMSVTSQPEETRKRLTAALLQGTATIVLDNIMGPIVSDSLCTALSQKHVGDRILGESANVNLTSRSLILATGNNLVWTQDMPRRVRTARLDPGMAEPWKRKFALDPERHVRQHRLKMIAAALTVLRAGIKQGPELDTRSASFEPWSDSVRRTVVWVGEEGFLGCDDPDLSVDTANEGDPETMKLGALLTAWYDEFRDLPVTVAELIKAARNDEGGSLFDALDELAGERGRINPRRLGRWIEKHRDKMLANMKVEKAGARVGKTTWRVRLSA